MKKKKTLKLSLNKRTISELNKSTQNAVNGGGFGSYGSCVVSIDVPCKSASACYVCNTDVGC